MLEHQRDDVIRALVLQFQTALEDLLDIWLKCRLLGISVDGRGEYLRTHRVSSRAVDEVISGGKSIGFDRKLTLMLALGMLRKPVYKKLIELNRLRNKCSHNWLLNVHIRKGIKPTAKKRPLLQFEGRNLHKVEVVHDFATEYGLLYLKLWEKIYA